jgi:hypothetical protein
LSELAEVEPGTYGPVSVSFAEGGLSLWVSPGHPTRPIQAVTLDQNGVRRSAPSVVGQTEADLGLVVLEPVAKERQALLVYSTQTESQSTKVRALLLDENAKAKGAPLELATLQSALLWLDVVDTASGPTVFYAVGREDRAEVRAVGLTPNQMLRFADREVVSGVRAWQLVKSADGAALAVVSSEEKGRGGKVSLRLLDDQATFVGKPIELLSEGSAELDLDLTRVGNAYVLAWSERRQVDSTVMLAAVDATGKVIAPPTPATPLLGEQSLVKLVPPGPLGRAALLWEELNLPNGRRRLSMAEVDDKGKVVSNIVYVPCSAQANPIPEVVATPKGWSILTVDENGESSTSEESSALPVYVELGPELIARRKSVVRFGNDSSGIPLLTWGLDCKHGCRATAAFDGPSVSVKTVGFGDVGLEPSAMTEAQAFVGTQASRLPRLERLESVLEVEPLADLAVSRGANGYKLSYLTYFEAASPLAKLSKPGPDGRTDPLQARTDVLSLSEAFNISQPSTISFRATSQPGVSVAVGGTDAAETVVAWSALDQGQPQVFATLFGPDGKKRAQRMLTRRQGALDEVTVVPAADGYYLAWLDERATTTDVYGLRVSKNLEKRGNELRISQGTGQVTALAVLPRSNGLLSVWAEVKKSDQRRLVDVYARSLSAVDGAPLAPAKRLLENSGAVKFLTLTPYGEGALLAWLEVMQEGNSVDAPGRVRYLRLDDKGAIVSPTMALSAPNLVPVSFALDCPNDRCRGIVTTDLGGHGELLAFDFDPTVATVPTLTPLLRSLGTVEQNVAPVLLGEHVFAVDQLDAERARVWHATVRWQ